MPSNHLILCHPLPLLLSNISQHQSFPMSQLFTSGSLSIGVPASVSVLPMNIQDWFPLGWTGWISCCPRDSQESSPTPQFKNINSLMLTFLYSPTLTSIPDYLKKNKVLTRRAFDDLLNIMDQSINIWSRKNMNIKINSKYQNFENS